MIIGALSLKLLDGTNNKVEAQALIVGIKLAKLVAIKPVWIEGDFVVIINACKQKKLNQFDVKFHRNPWFQNIVRLLFLPSLTLL